MSYFALFFHSVPGEAGAIEGFLHPLLGLEHLLAMVTVGLLSAQIGGRAIWLVPSTFVGVMIIGAVLGFVATTLGFINAGIALSVILLGTALVIQRSIPEVVTLAVIAFFGAFHGYAHGSAVPAEQDILFLIAYIVGFVTATAGLHVIGAMLGYISLRSDRGTLTLRVVGALVALIGVVLFFRI